MRFTAEEIALFEAAAKAKSLPVREWITFTLTEASKEIT